MKYLIVCADKSELACLQAALYVYSPVTDEDRRVRQIMRRKVSEALAAPIEDQVTK